MNFDLFKFIKNDYLALEYMDGGEIIWREDDESNTPVLTMDEARSIFRDVVSGLDYRKHFFKKKKEQRKNTIK